MNTLPWFLKPAAQESTPPLLQLGLLSQYKLSLKKRTKEVWSKLPAIISVKEAYSLVSISVDCDEDVLLLEIEQEGGISCHTGRESCFYRTLENDVWKENAPVLKDPAEMYKK